jgi:hypothetical protein
MYARLDDELLDHPKVSAAGDSIGKGGYGVSFGFYGYAILWANRQLTDGFIPLHIVKTWSTKFDRPLAIADALVRAGLLEKNGDQGYHIHDFKAHNPSAAAIKQKRKDDRERKRRERAGK